MSSLRQKTVSGVFWTGLAKTSMQVMLLIVMFILARLLSEADFGIVAMAGIITIALGMVNEQGLGTAIIQKKSITNSQIVSVFWGSIAFGLLLFVLGVVAAFPVSRFYNEQLIRPVIIVLSGGFLIGAFGIVQKALLTKEMAFKKLAIIEMAGVTVSGIAAIIMALLKCGVWSLVMMALLRDLVTVILLWFYHQWRPTRHFSWREFKELLSFSANVLGNDIALYLVANADITIIGKMLGKVMLGYYSLAMNLVKIPVTRLTAIVGKVVYPAFSELQDNVQSFKNSYLRSITFISLITFPLLAGLCVFSHEFILVFLGEKWLPMSLPLILLAPMAMLKSVGSIRGSVFMACGKPQIGFIWNMLFLIPLIAGVIFGVRYGLNGAAAAYSIVYVITYPLIQHITNRLIDTTMVEFLHAMSISAYASVLMVFAGLAVKLVFAGWLSNGNLLVLLIGVLISILVYYLSIRILKKSLLDEFVNLLKSIKSKKSEVNLNISEAPAQL
ncbi:MAG TPA: MOP flippase family protein [bacterium]|nr:MOP flippase family protein [bacterium]HPN44922.1 MOP flippase family protein [bacterium]